MAILNVSLCCSKLLPPNPKSRLHFPSLPFQNHRSPKELTTQIQVSQNSLGESVAKASFLALLSASLFFASDPALAFKGGGPYGSEVTRGADLSDADLRGADFSLANVTKANLTNANLEGALATGNTSFKGSIIRGADFTDVPLRDDQLAYLCKVADGVNPTTGNKTRETLVCKVKLLSLIAP